MNHGVHRLILLVAGAGLTLGLATAADAGDTDKFCSGEARNIVLYLDVTTPYDRIDRDSLVDGVEKIYANLQDGDRFVIRTIEDEFPRSRRLIEACLPHCARQGFLKDLFSDCTEGVVIEEKRKLQRRLVEEIRRLADQSVELDHSEIIRTIAMSATEDYRPDQANTLFIFSDMIENSAYLPSRQFLGTGNNAILSNLARDRLVPDLRDTTVRIFGVGRKGDEPRDALEQAKIEKIADFWDAFFSLAGATMRLQPNLGFID